MTDIRFQPSAPSWRWLAKWVWWVEHAFERARAHQRPEEDTRVRIFLVLAVFSVLFACLALGATRGALFSGHGARGGGVGGLTLARGDLVDRNGLLLAANVTHYSLFVDPAEVWDRPVAMRQMRRALPRIPAKQLREAMYGDGVGYVMGGLTPAEKGVIHALGLGGIEFQEEDRRVYPLGTSAAHVVGFTEVGGEGLTGAEAAFERDIVAAGKLGGSVALSIDLRVQGVLENELGAKAAELGVKGAVGIVTDIQTGEVLATASYPTFDLNERGNAPLDHRLNRVAAGHYEMGSVFKAFTVAAGIDTGQADMNTTFDATGFSIGDREINDFHAQNRVLTLEEVFLHSSNIGTSRLAVDLGPDVMRSYFKKLGLLDRAPIELTESAAPVVPRNWGDSTLASLSFGYGIMPTPVQLAAAMGSLLNGGEYVPLSLRKGGAVGAERRRVVSERTSLVMLDLMRRNVVKGSGGFADAAGLRVGGKTGSANKVVNGRYDPTHAVGSFAAVFPADGPVDAKRYLVFILMDEPQGYPRTGGYVAAPVAGRVISRIAPFLGVRRAADRWSTADGEKIPQAEDVKRLHAEAALGLEPAR